LAVDKDTGEKFAIKIIEKKRMSKAPGGEAKLMDEVNILMKIKHPGCIGIHEVFDTQDRLYLVLEL
jgi:serine/threonine-protein kinase Chk2